MKIKVLAAMTAALAASASAEQKLDVFVNNGERIPFATLQSAEGLASRIVASADVRIAWHGLARPGWKGQNRVIIIQLELDTPAAYHPGALDTRCHTKEFMCPSSITASGKWISQTWSLFYWRMPWRTR